MLSKPTETIKALLNGLQTADELIQDLNTAEQLTHITDSTDTTEDLF